jgi:hypothetical protein
MSAEDSGFQDAINRALKAASRALKANAYGKVADIYYRIAYMLNDIGDEAAARKFSDAAKQYKEKNYFLTEIRNTKELADQAYNKKDYSGVAENYLKISSLATAFGDMDTAKRFAHEAEKFMGLAKLQVGAEEAKLTTMTEISSNIQSEIPATIELKSGSRHIKTSKLGYDDALVALGLICGNCGHEINPDYKNCPNCGNKI